MKRVIILILLISISIYHAYSQADEEDVLEWYTIGDSLFNNRKYIEAYNVMSTVVLWSDSTYADAFYKKAVILRSMHECDRASEEIAFAIKLNPNVSDYYVLRGSIYQECVGFLEALNDYNKAIELDSLNDDAYVSRVEVWGECGFSDYQNLELSDYNKAIEINPCKWSYFFNRGQLKKAMGDMKGACEDWKKAIELGYSGEGWYCKSCNCDD